MPELPEVERGRRLAEQTAVGRTITRAKCMRDSIVFDGVTPATASRRLRGRVVNAVHRRGKQLWFELDRGPHPLFHFGMTGAFRTPDATPIKLASSRKKGGDDAEWPPRFTKIHLTFDDGGELVMTNARRLGRILFRDEPLAEKPLSALGFDPLLDLPAPRAFVELLGRRKGPMKAVLLDQGFAAGVGNWIADEILFQARIDPRRRANTLSDAEARAVRTRMRAIIRKAVDVNADKKRFPRAWLFHRRWGKDAEATMANGDRIEHITLGGRTTAWVPAVQT